MSFAPGSPWGVFDTASQPEVPRDREILVIVDGWGGDGWVKVTWDEDTRSYKPVDHESFKVDAEFRFCDPIAMWKEVHSL